MSSDILIQHLYTFYPTVGFIDFLSFLVKQDEGQFSTFTKSPNQEMKWGPLLGRQRKERKLIGSLWICLGFLDANASKVIIPLTLSLPFSSYLLEAIRKGSLTALSFFLSRSNRAWLSALGRKVMTNLDSIFKSRDITLPTKVHLVKAMVFPVVMYGCESWTVKKAERRRIDAFELWY